MERILKFTKSTVLDSYPYAIRCSENIKTIEECYKDLNTYNKYEAQLFKIDLLVNSAIIAIENYLYH